MKQCSLLETCGIINWHGSGIALPHAKPHTHCHPSPTRTAMPTSLPPLSQKVQKSTNIARACVRLLLHTDKGEHLEGVAGAGVDTDKEEHLERVAGARVDNMSVWGL